MWCILDDFMASSQLIMTVLEPESTNEQDLVQVLSIGKDITHEAYSNWRSKRSEWSHSQFMTIEIRDICQYSTCMQHKSLRWSTVRVLTYHAKGPGSIPCEATFFLLLFFHPPFFLLFFFSPFFSSLFLSCLSLSLIFISSSCLLRYFNAKTLS